MTSVDVRKAGMNGVSNRSYGGALAAPFTCAWRHRFLLRRLIQRDIDTRYRGTLLGKTWAALLPLAMLTMYAIVFGMVIQPRWQDKITNQMEIPLIYITGLILFDFLFECVGRAPNLLRENHVFIKKVVFPVEILAWMVVGTALFRFAVTAALVFVLYLAVVGVPFASVVLAPILVIALIPFAVGLVWLLSSLGVYFRDVSHVVAVTTPIIMFVSPVFYPVSAAPPVVQNLLYLNPLTFAIEAIRGSLFTGSWQSPAAMLAYFIAGWATLALGYFVFMKLRPGFADVV